MIRHDHASTGECAAALADALAAAVTDVLESKSRASLALSGGRSPETVLPLLAAAPVDWSRVDVTLVDDRRVPQDDRQSNAGLVGRAFLQRGAAAATFHPLWHHGRGLADAVANANVELAPLFPLDVAYLGMGPDGHIASLFPADDAAAFDGDGTPVIASEAPSAPHGRISLTFLELSRIKCLFLHVTGPAKIQVLEHALACAPTPSLPVSLLVHARPDIEAYECP